jgi:hypothetical protein
MNARFLISQLRDLGVSLTVEGENLTVDAPAGVLTDEHREALSGNKGEILALLTRERHKLEAADERGLVIRYSKQPGWIALHDPTTGEWHEVRESECLPSVVEAAKHNRRSKSRKRDGAA